MKDRLSTIMEMNKGPLQQHALELLQQAKEQTSEQTLYLTQVINRFLEDNQMIREWREEMNYKTFNQMMIDAESLIIKDPEIQMVWLMNSGLTDEENREEVMKCKTPDELTDLLIYNIMYNRAAIEAAEQADLDATIMGYND